MTSPHCQWQNNVGFPSLAHLVIGCGCQGNHTQFLGFFALLCLIFRRLFSQIQGALGEVVPQANI